MSGGRLLDLAHQLELALSPVKLGESRGLGRSGWQGRRVVLDGHEDFVFALARHAAEGPAALLLHYAGAEPCLTAVDDHAADGADDQTETDNANQGVGHDQRLSESRCRETEEMRHPFLDPRTPGLLTPLLPKHKLFESRISSWVGDERILVLSVLFGD